MWILPKTHKEYLAFAQELEELSEELKELWKESDKNSTPLLMLKSKPLSLPTLLRAWKRVYWIPVLFGRILKPSLGKAFTEKYTESLEDIHVSHFLWPVGARELKTLDIYGRILPRESEQLNLFGVSLKTSPDILHSGMILSEENFKKWVTMLRKEYSVRKKLALRTEEKGYLSLQSWGTPRVFMYKDAKEDRGKGNLGEQVMNPKNWATPTVHQQNTRYKQGGQSLAFQAKNWPTATTRDYKGCGNAAPRKDGRSRMDTLEAVVKFGQQDQEKINTTGKNQEQLNPVWVAQLIGTTLEKIFYVPLVTELWSKQQK